VNRFRVIASNKDGACNEAGRSLEIVVAPAYRRERQNRVPSVLLRHSSVAPPHPVQNRMLVC
jgi:hypothetical protein